MDPCRRSRLAQILRNRVDRNAPPQFVGGGLEARRVLGDQNQRMAFGGSLAGQLQPDPAAGAGDQGEGR